MNIWKRLLGYQDTLLEQAKAELRRTGRLMGGFHLVFDRAGTTVPHELPVHLWKEASADDLVLVLDHRTGPLDLLSLMAEHAEPVQSQWAKMLLELLRRAGTTDAKAVYSAIQASGADEHDVYGAAVRGLAARFKAYAVVHVNDAWIRTFKPPANLKKGTPEFDAYLAVVNAVKPSQAPDRQEVIISNLETLDHRRLITQPYRRRGGREDGKVEGFDEADIKETGGPDNVEVQGRLTGWLAPAPVRGGDA